MKTGNKGIELIKSFEGLAKLGKDGLVYPYLDAVQVPTIGYGNTYYPGGKKVSMKDAPITKAKAEELLRDTLSKFESCVERMVKVKVSQNEFDALVSFAYNVGVNALEGSTLLRTLNAGGSKQVVAAQFGRWNKAGGLELAGLTRRRKAEAELFLK